MYSGQVRLCPVSPSASVDIFPPAHSVTLFAVTFRAVGIRLPHILNKARLPRIGDAAILPHVVGYETIMGPEVHAQLLTKRKTFCSCSADYASSPPDCGSYLPR